MMCTLSYLKHPCWYFENYITVCLQQLKVMKKAKKCALRMTHILLVNIVNQITQLNMLLPLKNAFAQQQLFFLLIHAMFNEYVLLPVQSKNLLRNMSCITCFLFYHAHAIYNCFEFYAPHVLMSWILLCNTSKKDVPLNFLLITNKAYTQLITYISSYMLS